MEPTKSAPALPGAHPRRTGGAPASEAPTRRSRAHTLHALERRRITAGYDSPQELADASGVSRQQVANIEAGRVNGYGVRTATARKLAKALRVAHLVLIDELRDPYADLLEPQQIVVTEGTS